MRHGDSELAIQGRDGLTGGSLVGADNGEFGGHSLVGTLLWKLRRGDGELLYQGNIAAIASSPEGGAIVVAHEGGGEWAFDSQHDDPDSDVVLISNGPTGFGFALDVTRDSSGRWQMREIARLPQGEVMVRSIGKDL